MVACRHASGRILPLKLESSYCKGSPFLLRTFLVSVCNISCESDVPVKFFVGNNPCRVYFVLIMQLLAHCLPHRSIVDRKSVLISITHAVHRQLKNSKFFCAAGNFTSFL